MDETTLIKKLAESAEKVPAKADVLALRSCSLNEIEGRAKRLLRLTGEACGCNLDRGDWTVERDRTLIRLPQGARMMVFHASGAMRLVTGLNPMESLFKKVEERQTLTKGIEELAARLRIKEWIGPQEALKFERLWQIKAAAVDRKGKTTPPVLCRAVGAYRHYVNGVPVWGAASVAIKVAGDNQLDTLTIQTREPSGEVVEQVKTIRPDEAARHIILQMTRLMGNSKVPLAEIAAPQWMRFGYLSFSKRKVQRLLAPVYVAAIETKGAPEAQAYLFAVSATETAYLSLCRDGSEAPTTRLRGGYAHAA